MELGELAVLEQFHGPTCAFKAVAGRVCVVLVNPGQPSLGVLSVGMAGRGAAVRG